MADEWTIVAEKYVKVFQPRFQPIYDNIADIVVSHYAKGQSTSHPSKLLDFAAGPGEPSKTILTRLPHDTTPLKMIISDWSEGMLKYAQKSAIETNTNTKTKTNIEVEILQLASEEPSIRAQILAQQPLDIVTASLVLMYIQDRDSMLQTLHQSLSPNGLLIASYWCHPSVVPFLRILKHCNYMMSRQPTDPLLNEDERVEAELREVVGSCILWDEEKTRSLLEKNGFEVVEWKTLELDTTFASVWDLLQFSDVAPWYQEEDNKKRAIQIGEEMVAKELNISVEEVRAGPWKLNNQYVVFAARKKS
ncbi:hypothetical protein HDV05_008560 [Chytridiales sp. JEL 0842]|nr:hypothetical protein HDV05_008560 [Chytridiales sp. JEL 0842]